jgi:signal transduction histidine kinase
VSDLGSTPESSADLVSKLTHEIRGPVSTLRGLVGTTLTHYDRLSDDERREFLHLMRHEADRLERTVEHVALALKLDAGSLRFDIRPRDLAEIVRETAQAADTGDHPMEVDVAGSIEALVDGALIASVVHQLIDK